MVTVPRGIAVSVPVVLVDASTGERRTSPIIAAGDFQISKDFGAYANLASLPVETPAGSGLVKVDLSASETDADVIDCRIVDQTATKEWQDSGFALLTFGAGYIEGEVATATSTTEVTLSAGFPATTDAFVDSAIEVLSGDNKGITRKVTAYTSGRVATFEAFPSAFSAGDRVRLGGVVK